MRLMDRTVKENLDLLRSTKANIKAAIENKGVTVGDVPYSQYAEKIGEISGGSEPVLEELNVTNNGIYTPAEGVDGFNKVTVDVPVEGYTIEQYTEGISGITILNNNATKVRSYGFYSDSNLTVVNLPMCERLEDYAFQNCKNLSVLSLPKCTNIGTYALGGCSALASIDLPECSYVGTGGFSYCSFSLVSLPKCTNIGNYGFTNCTKLINIDLPVCSTLGASALNSCTSLSYANLPLLSSLSAVFTNCFRLASVSIPMCTFVGTNAFLKCSELTSVDIPLISSFGNTVFQSCTKLMELHLGSSTYTIANYGTNMFSNATAFLASGSIYVPACNYSKYITTTGWSSLSARFVSVGDPDEALLSVDADGRLYGNTVVLYSNYSTYVGTNSITAVDLPNLRTLSSVVFSRKPITYISMPKIQSLPTNFASGCSQLSSLYLPECTSVGTNAFQACSVLQSIDLHECTSVGNNAFNACSSLQSIDLPLCSYVGSGAFQYCSALQTVSLPECTTVSSYAFSGCSKLKSIDLPVCSILEQNAFYTCRGLRSIYLRYPSICQGNASMFYLTPMYDSTYLGYYGSIYVPASLVDAYKVAPYWSGYSNRITAISE